jgi:undecaprenyl-diphosphatase
MATADAEPDSGRGDRPRIVAFVNAASGAGSTDDETVDRLRSAGVEVREQDPRSLGEAVARAVAEGVGAIAIVGGDGSQQAAATVLADGEVPLLVVPGGTWNHFAKALGIGGIDAVTDASSAVGSIACRWVR